jgi:hypothetical protein
VRHRTRLAALGAALALLLSLLAVTGAAGFGPSVGGYGEGRIAYDCAGGASLAPGSKTTVDWVIWCGPVTGKMNFQITPPKRAGAVEWGAAPQVSGPAGPARCRQQGPELACDLRKTGPITVRGSLTEPAGACAGKTAVAIHDSDFREGEPFYGQPWGCPGSRPPHPPKLSAILKFRAAEVLDPGLAGDHAALVAKARRLRQAWIEEAPTERWSQVAWGSPLDAKDAKLKALRSHALEQAGGLIEAWVTKHRMQSTYAGWTWGADGSIYVGFTTEPEATVARLRKEVPFLEPAFVKPFPTAPRYTEVELEALTESIIEEIEGGSGLSSVVGVGLDVLANKVQVGSTDPAKVRAVLATKFGTEAPIEVVRERPAVLL